MTVSMILVRFSLIYHMHVILLFQGGLMFGTPGSGGQMAYGDSDNKLGWAFITNYCNPTALNDDPRYSRLEKAMYDTIRNL